MKVRRMMAAAAMAALAACAAIGDTASADGPKIGEKKRRGLARLAAEGGPVALPFTGMVFRVVNAQRTADKGLFASYVEGLKTMARLPVQMVDIEPKGTAMEAVAAGFAMDRSRVVLALVDDASTPTLLVAPEDCWAAINVRKLLADSPKEGVQKARLQKELWRAAAYVLGAANSRMYTQCVMRQINSLADLDAEPWLVASPEPFMKMQETARKLGLDMVRMTSYRHACMMGLAPPPANDLQRKIAEEVKAEKERGPSKPITIPPPSKKGK